MPTSVPFLASPADLQPKSSHYLVGLVYESLCKFRALKIKQRTSSKTDDSGASHNLITEAKEATTRKRKRLESLPNDIEQSALFNNVDTEQQLESILEDIPGLETSPEETRLAGSDFARQFAIETVLNLNEKELDSLIHFFSKEDMEHDTENLQQLLTNEIKHFRVQETSLTKEDASEILPLPFLIVAGRCAKKHYQESKKYSIKELKIKLKGNISITSEILFEAQSVRRITAFVDHPAATMFNPNSAAKYCLRLDSTLNFFMWLLAVPHNEMSFTETAARIRKGKPGNAPLPEVHQYAKREATLGRTLTVLEYDPDFLHWASTTLKEDVFKILDAGQSVAKVLRTKINKSISESLQSSSKFAAANRRRNADRHGFEFKEFWDAEEVTVLAKGYVSLHLSQETRALKFFLPLEARTKCLAAQKKNKKAAIFFTKTGVELRLEGESILTRTIDELQEQRSFGQDGVDQHRKELARKAAIAREKGRGEKTMSLDQQEE